jgi:F0F1-type ATP synthase assembly protein I
VSRPKSPIPQNWSVAIDFGYTLLAAELLLGGAGYWADKRFNTEPWLVIVGILLGLFVSFRSLFRSLKNLENADRDGGPGR